VAWVAGNKSIDVSVCIIIKKRKNKTGKWETQEVSRFIGDWSDLVYELYVAHGQFESTTKFLTSKRAVHERLDEIAFGLSRSGVEYTFMKPDHTDDEYAAICKNVNFKLDHTGQLN
jgi:hypothetical protein